jgi:hypothetical protein
MPDFDKTVHAWTNPTYDASAPVRSFQGGTHYLHAYWPDFFHDQSWQDGNIVVLLI